MPKPKSIEINIPHPCTQSWDEMTPDGQGRHCAHCEKTVIDFTRWSDAALHKYFTNYDGRTCGRFLALQVNRPIAIPHQPHSQLYRMTITLGLSLMFTLPYDAHAQAPPPSTGIIEVSTTPRPFIAGRVADNANRPVENAVIQVYQGGLPKGNALTDADGNYTIMCISPDAGYYDMIMLCVGYDSFQYNKVVVTPGSIPQVNFTVNIDTTISIEVEKIAALQALDALPGDRQKIRGYRSEEHQQPTIMGEIPIRRSNKW